MSNNQALAARIASFASGGEAFVTTNVPLVLSNDEATMLRDLRATRSDSKASEKQRKALKAEVMRHIKQRLGIPADVKVAVELDDTRNPTYLQVKGDVGGGRRVLTTADFAPARAGVPVSNKRWYKLGYDDDTLMSKLANDQFRLTPVLSFPPDDVVVTPDLVINGNDVFVNVDADDDLWSSMSIG